MYSKRTAPSVATRTDQTLKPVVPDPPRTPTTKPPTEAPAIPRRTVTIKRPGSGPGTIRLANDPAMTPTTIQLTRPMYYLFRAMLFALRPVRVVCGPTIGAAFGG